MTENPLPLLRALIERLRKEGEAVGLELRRAVIVPGDPDVLEAVFTVASSMFVSDEQREYDAQFADIEKQLETQTREETLKKRSKAAQTELEKWLEEQ